MENQEQYEQAKKQVTALRGFYSHLTVYLVVNIGLMLLNTVTHHGGWWWPWAAFGWGIGLVAHAANVFVFPGFLGKEWEERKIKEIMSKRNEP